MLNYLLMSKIFCTFIRERKDIKIVCKDTKNILIEQIIPTQNGDKYRKIG